PAFKLANASEKLRAILLANRERISTRTESSAWETQLATWDKDAGPLRLVIKGSEPSTDNVWRIPVSERAEIELQTESAIQRIEWIRLVPEYSRCNLTANRADEIGFARGAPPRPRWREIRVPGRERTVSVANNIGAIRLKARVEIDGRVRETPAREVRRFAGNGFRAAITEQFELPYLFGSGELNDGNNTGPETGFGADCANFAVYALRRQGRAVPWSNPKQLRKYLEPVAENVRAGETAIREDLGGDVMLGRTIGLEIERGADPFAAIRPRLERASSRIVNLECVLSEKGAAIAGKRYCFRAPLDAMRVLTAARINAVSLANNHARDF